VSLPILETLGLAVGLGADAMSVCTAVGVRWNGPHQKLRLASMMGLFQFAMPIVGWLAGRKLATLLAGWGRYIAAGLVIALGVKMLYEALRSHPGVVAEEAEHAVEHALHVHSKDPTRGWSLLILSIATSIDALVVGFSLGLRGSSTSIWQASILIGVVAAAMALIGVELGKRIGSALGKKAEAVGAIILIALGVAFLWL